MDYYDKSLHCERCWHINIAHSTSRDYCADADCDCHLSKSPLDSSGAGWEEKLAVLLSLPHGRKEGLRIYHEGHLRSIRDFIRAEKEKSKQEAESSAYERVVEVLEGMKGWKNCIKGDVSHGPCPGCAERTGWNKALSEAISKIEELKG